LKGGSKLLNSFIDSVNWNEARIFVGEKEFKKGIKAPVFDKTGAEMEIVGVDKLYTIKK
jgi:diaminohydroxyphosphoribosylaminopyrimidine deaminase/5-amino-6-(5-phosphoribosylamino)uracil reductase